MLDTLEIPRSMLPEVRASSEVYGTTHASLFASRIPLAGIAGDQHAALFGQMCTQPGMVKNTYGTGCFLGHEHGTQPIESSNNLVTTIAWKIGDQVNYALEGSIFIGGAVVQWLRDGLGMIKSAADIEALARSRPAQRWRLPGCRLRGTGAPHWNARARGTLFGVTRGTTAGHLARAALDSIAYQSIDVLKAIGSRFGIRIGELRVDGGAVANDLLMQFQADILGVDVVRPQVSETTALGAAYLAGLAVITGRTWMNCKASGSWTVVSRRILPPTRSSATCTAGNAR